MKKNNKLILIIIISIIIVFIIFWLYNLKNCMVENFSNSPEMEKIFSDIYENNVWGNNNNDEYKGSSGDGSEINYNIKEYVPFIKQFIRDKNIKNIIDLGSGDFKAGPLIYDDLDVIYTGYDTYKKIVDHNSKKHSKPKYNFIHLDFYNNKDKIINGDLCILKDVIQHWSLQHIYTFLDYLVESKKFKYILVINCSYQKENNTDIKNGDFRPLSIDYYPLKKYNPKKIHSYNTKEISVIET